MIKKLNNRGLTVVEIIVCFALTSVIIVSMFNVVNNYRTKQDEESYKTDIVTYKNTITKVIQSDIINNLGVVSAKISPTGSDENDYNYEQTITLTYSNGNKTTIKVLNNTKCYDVNPATKEKQLDQSCNDRNSSNIDTQNSEYYIEITDSNNTKEKFVLPKIFYLRFNSVELTTGEEEPDKTGIVKIHVGLIHPDLGSDYDALNIITPNVSIYKGALG